MGLFSAIGSLVGAGASLFGSKKNNDLQKDFAKSGIQWKVADAKKAGIHPLAALGAQTHSFAPTSVGDIGGHLANAGQSIDRAVDSTASSTTRAANYTTEINQLTVERGKLENEILRQKLASNNALRHQAGRSPGLPTDDPGLTGITGMPPGTVIDGPQARINTAPGSPFTEAGAVPDLGYARTAAGGYFPVMPKDQRDRLDDDTLGMLFWNLRNRMIPYFGGNRNPPAHVPLHPGNMWIWHPQGEYRQVPKRPSYYR